MTFFQGGSVPDLFSGTIDADTILGGDGNDTLAGGAQGDFIDGEAGDDYLYSASVSPPYTLPDRDGLWTAPMLDNGNEADTINGGDGSDHIFAGYGDSVDGGADGAYGDYLYISFLGAPSGVTADFSFTTISIGGGTITGIENISWVQGSNEADTITIGTPSFSGFSEYTAVLGMGGDDQLTAGYYTGTMDGGDGDDIVD
ncbi:MAG TPA: hypothetical protein VFP14_13865, partial [Novosphingobium sp.]|nr:hypothetical protein [Novosphingobium sp.]